MDFFIMGAVLAVVFIVFKKKDEARRIALLGSYLGKYEIEKLMETLTEGYMRALGTEDLVRREQIFNQLSSTEQKLSAQFSNFAAEFAKVPAPDAGISKLPLPARFIDKLFPAFIFDMRKALAIHAQGISQAQANSAGRPAKSRAFTLSAELFLMQHTCHWFCKSRAVASARMLVRHQTAYGQLVESVSPETRRAYTALVGG